MTAEDKGEYFRCTSQNEWKLTDQSYGFTLKNGFIISGLNVVSYKLNQFFFVFFEKLAN